MNRAVLAFRDRVVPLDRGVHVVGRDLVCDLCWQDDLLSRVHAAFFEVPQGFALIDLASSNGTTVNGAKVGTPVVLRPGDRIQIGSIDFFFDLVPASDGEAPGAAPSLPHRPPDRAALLDALAALHGAPTPEAADEALLQAALRLSGADAARLALFDGVKFEDRTARAQDGKNPTTNELLLVEGVARDWVLENHRSLYVPWVTADPRVVISGPLKASGLGSAACVPLTGLSGLQATLFVATRLEAGALSPSVLSPLELLAAHAAVRLERTVQRRVHSLQFASPPNLRDDGPREVLALTDRDRTLLLTRSFHVLGRDARCQLTWDDGDLAPFQALLVHKERGYFLFRLDQAGVLLVNGQPPPAPLLLQPGARLSAGATPLDVRSVEAGAASRAAGRLLRPGESDPDTARRHDWLRAAGLPTALPDLLLEVHRAPRARDLPRVAAEATLALGGGDHGCVVLEEEGRWPRAASALRPPPRQDVRPPQVPADASLARDAAVRFVRQRRQTLHAPDARCDARLRGPGVAAARSVLSCACVPLVAGDRVVGALYAEAWTEGRPVPASAVPWLEVLAFHVALALAARGEPS